MQVSTIGIDLAKNVFQVRGIETVGAQFTLNMVAFNLAKLPKLLPA